MKHLRLILALALTGCARQTFITPGTFVAVGTAKVERCPHCDAQAFLIHFPKKVDYKDFDATIPGVSAIVQNDPHSILVRIGVAFDQMEVVKKIIKSQGKKTKHV